MCLAPSSGLSIHTRNITRIPAPAYAAALMTAGLRDGSITIAAPADKPVTGESALVGVLKAFSVCSAGQPPDSQRVRLAYEQLNATVALAGDTSDLTHASAAFLYALHALVTGEAQDDLALEAALNTATSQEGVPLDDAKRSEIIAFLHELRGVDFGPYSQGYRIEQLGPDQVRVVPAPGT